MNIIKIESANQPIKKGKSFGTIYYTETIITLENGDKTDYTVSKGKLKDLKAFVSRLPFAVHAAWIDNDMISIGYGSNLL